MALSAKFKVEAPKIQPSNAPAETGNGNIVRLMNPPSLTPTQ
jgi:hypothetical protein